MLQRKKDGYIRRLPTFCQNFKVSNDDILYGLRKTRTRYLKALSKAKLDKIEAKKARGDYIDPEKYRSDKEAAEQLAETPGLMIHSYNHPITYGKFSKKEITLAEPKEGIEFSRYAEALHAHPRYSPRMVQPLSYVELSKNDTTLARRGKVRTEDANAALKLQAIRRACKFGIEYFSSTGKSQVHYVLDENDFETVLTKKTMHLPAFDVNGTPISTSELRFLCKYWNRLNQKRIHFYLEGEEAPAPWVTNRDLWASLLKKQLPPAP